MVLVNLARVVKIMQENTCFYWTLYDGKSIFDAYQDISGTMDESILRLQETVQDISGQTIDIKISDRCNDEKAKGGRGFKNFEYKIKLSGTGDVSGIGAIGGGGNVVLSLLREINELKTAQIKAAYEIQLKEIERKMDELKEAKGGLNMDTALNKVFAFISENPGFLTGNTAKVTAPGLAGPPEGEQAVFAPDTDTKVKMRNALVRLSKVDANIAETLTALADFAESNPEKYKQYIPILKTL